MSRHGNEAFALFQTPWSETFPGLLRQAGYWTGHIGKWHNGPFPADHFDFGRCPTGHALREAAGRRDIHITEKNEKDTLEFLKDRPKDRPFS